MEVNDVFTPKVLRIASNAANKVVKQNRFVVEYDDVVSECWQWVAENKERVVEWIEDGGRHGQNKLSLTLYRVGRKYAIKERAARSGVSVADFYWYTPAVVEELLPDIFEYEDWVQSGNSGEEKVKGRSQPSEGGNRTAMLIDVAAAYRTLSDEDKDLLRDRYGDGGVDVDVLAARMEITADGVRKKINRVVEKMVERLGGEPPFWQTGRRSKTNAHAQHDNREGYAE